MAKANDWGHNRLPNRTFGALLKNHNPTRPNPRVAHAIPGQRAGRHRRATEGDRLRAAGRVVGKRDGALYAARGVRRKSHIDSAVRSGGKSCATVISLCKIRAGRNICNSQRSRAGIGKRDEQGFAARAFDLVTKGQAIRRERDAG
jgi:hypothetical protein